MRLYGWLLVSACQAPPADSAAAGAGPRACNGHPTLCARPLTEITLPGTHNSMSNADAGWVAPNQPHGISRQLADGVRALMLDTYEEDGELLLCHGYCSLGSQPLADGLAEIRTFLDAHPDDLIAIIFQDAIPAARTAEAMEAAGLAGRAMIPGPALTTTPLGAWLDDGVQLLVGLEAGGPPPDWLPNAWDVWVDTPYSFASVDAFSCAVNRGAPDNPLTLVNHWISDPLPRPENAVLANAEAVLEGRARACASAWGRPVNILAVDFYTTGDLFPVVRALNGIDGRPE
jgi:hypothetical protein